MALGLRTKQRATGQGAGGGVDSRGEEQTMADRDDQSAGTAGGRDADVAAPTGVGAAPGGTGHVGVPGAGAGALGGAVGTDIGAGGPDDGTKGGRIGDDQNASAGAAGAAVGNQSGAVDQG